VVVWFAALAGIMNTQDLRNCGCNSQSCAWQKR